ncbi:MAG: hypothetical protein HC867_08015 [Bacteroidia bacterium]|nr:hypothetical protein [Bacteroidia bacterium]
MKKAREVAERSMKKGTLPFGCVLVNENNEGIEEGANTVITDKDSIAHCAINLVHQLAGKYDGQYLNKSPLYASTEPCPSIYYIFKRLLEYGGRKAAVSGPLPEEEAKAIYMNWLK